MNSFIANLFEYFRQFGAFSQTLFRGAIYSQLGLIILGVALLSAIIYYFLVDHPELNTIFWWLIWLLGTGLTGALTVWIRNFIYFRYRSTAYNPVGNFYVSIEAAIFTIILFFIFSIIFKWFTINTRKTPF